MNLQWFALQTLTGQEHKVKLFLEANRRREGLEDAIGEVLMPTEKVAQVRQVRVRDKKSGDPKAYRMESKKSIVTKRLFPGYVFVEAAVYDDAHKINERVWSFIRHTQGVICFVGGDPPTPMKASDVENLTATTSEGAKDKARPAVVYEPGDHIKIVDGPFMSFNGIVQEVDPDQGKLNVHVSIFGRETPVELEYTQVEHEKEVEKAPDPDDQDTPAP
jgi:transcriptional antiterminator NusG